MRLAGLVKVLLSIFIAWFVIYSIDAGAADADLKLQIMICESGLNSDKVGDGGASYGIAQFQKHTFREFAAMNEKSMRKRGMWPPSRKNPQHQLFLLDWGLDNGYANRWKTCYQKATKRGIK